MAMMAMIDSAIAACSLQRYEISNYAVPGRESRHNCNYWENGQYLGLGPGAVSAMGGTRRTAVADLAEYCRLAEAGQSVLVDEERLDQEAAFRETVVMGLRMLAGVSVKRLRQRFGLDLGAYYGLTLDSLIGQGFLILQEDHLRLSSQGLPLANRVMAELV
jgi:oxygen-independent coproporphyrinogen-3 oxidase